jgi:DNA-binding GntR family transcriptional regulator
MALDTLCARLAVERITSAELTEMKRLIAEYRSAAGKSDQAALMALDRHFHQLLAQSSHDKFLEAEIELFYNLSMRIWYLYLSARTP